jgi:PAS domain S-box-containing protein
MKKIIMPPKDCTCGEIGTYRQAEESLMESEILYKTLVNSLPNPIIIHVNGKVVFANDVIIEVTGIDKDEIIGKEISELLSDPVDASNKFLSGHLAGQEPVIEEEFEIRTENRKYVIKNFLIRNSKIKYKGEDAVMTILIDITERKHVEKYLLSKLIETEEKARKQFAADLHDDLGPTLSSIKLHLGLLEHSKNPEKFRETLTIANDLLSEAIAKMRIIANNLMPRLIENYGLEAAINSFVNTMPKKGTFSVEFVSNLNGRRFPRQIELHFYRIVCELINNTIKHAGATIASVKLNYSRSLLKLTYTDNGKGYKVEEINKKTSGMGVSNIFQRVNVIDGKIQFQIKKGKTELKIWKEL